MMMLAGLAGGALAQDAQKPYVSPMVSPTLYDGDLSTLPKVTPWTEGMPFRLVPRRRPNIPPPPAAPEPVVDPVLQTGPGGDRIPSPVVNFAGIGATGSVPPDVSGDVGPNHYIQMVNTVFAIYNKSGTLLAGPSAISTVWAGTGTACETGSIGDPVVLYDPLADRWLVSQLASGNHQCVAVSKTADPVAGGWWTYAFAMPSFPDYPKFAVWPDAYYVGANVPSTNIFAFNRAAMLAGAAANFVSFTQIAVGLHAVMLPSDLDGTRYLPPAGAPNTYYRFVDGDYFGGVDRLELFEFHVDWVTPANSTFTGPMALPHAAFASLCDFSFDCIQQPATPQRLDSITEWPMWRLQYRSHGDHQTLVGNHAVNVGSDQAGVRWFELVKVGAGAWTVRQDATYAPDTDSRWMCSVATDFMGNLAVGYSVSSTATYPSLRYAGRLAGDPLNTLSAGEAALIAGAGSQTGSNRWGDYHTMSVDPVDDCTFWFTGEYYATTSAAGWSTRIAAFRFPLCGDVIFRHGFDYGSM